MKILVACDSFKGSLRAGQASRIVASAINDARPDWKVRCQPLADGGEGTAEILRKAGAGYWVEEEGVAGPLHGMNLKASYVWLPGTGTAIVEVARASGITLLTVEQRNPLKASTYGTGQLLAAALERGAQELLLALGGSATVDGGTGAARALGWRFLDARGRDVPLGGGSLIDICRVVPSSRVFPVVSVLCDVTNPLCGPQGAARVFAPQKGATPAQVNQLAAGLDNLARVIEAQLGINVMDFPGGGAAGGFGAGAAAFLGGRLQSGVATVMEKVNFEEQVQWADWVITGEGCLDRTSLQGKVISGVLKTARRYQVPVAVLSGQVCLKKDELSQADIAVAMATMPEAMALEEGLSKAEILLDIAAQRLAARLATTE